jgi:hypothetical protein
MNYRATTNHADTRRRPENPASRLKPPLWRQVGRASNLSPAGTHIHLFGGHVASAQGINANKAPSRGATSEHSPAIHRRVWPPPATSPKGTAEIHVQPWDGRLACNLHWSGTDSIFPPYSRIGPPSVFWPAPRASSLISVPPPPAQTDQPSAEQGTGCAPQTVNDITTNPITKRPTNSFLIKIHKTYACQTAPWDYCCVPRSV